MLLTISALWNADPLGLSMLSLSLVVLYLYGLCRLMCLSGCFLIVKVYSERSARCRVCSFWVWVIEMAWFCRVWWCQWKSAYVFCAGQVIFWSLVPMFCDYKFLPLSSTAVSAVCTRFLIWKTIPCCIPYQTNMFKKLKSGNFSPFVFNPLCFLALLDCSVFDIGLKDLWLIYVFLFMHQSRDNVIDLQESYKSRPFEDSIDRRWHSSQVL